MNETLFKKEDELSELKHENRRLIEQTFTKTQKVLIEHLTLGTMTEYPVMIEAEV